MLPPSEDEKVQIARQLLHAEVEPKKTVLLFEAYFRHYQTNISPSEADDAVVQIETPALRNHSDVLEYTKSLYENHGLSRDEITKKSFATTPAEMKHISRAIVSVAFMIDCNERDYYPEGFGSDIPRAKWEKNQSFLDFLETSFYPLQQSSDEDVTLKNQTSLKAWKLVKRHGIRIRGTDNLMEHLLYDPRLRTLTIFHHVEYLRSHLHHSRNESLDMGFKDSLTLKTLPPRLLFETLLSLHSILFPIVDSRSKRSISLLEKYIKTQELDKELLTLENVRPVPSNFTFKYWGGRLERLQELIRQPPPRNSLVSWFERHTSERNALTVAIIGLFLTVLLGFLALVVGVFQLVIAWLAWKDVR